MLDAMKFPRELAELDDPLERHFAEQVMVGIRQARDPGGKMLRLGIPGPETAALAKNLAAQYRAGMVLWSQRSDPDDYGGVLP